MIWIHKYNLIIILARVASLMSKRIEMFIWKYDEKMLLLITQLLMLSKGALTSCKNWQCSSKCMTEFYPLCLYSLFQCWCLSGVITQKHEVEWMTTNVRARDMWWNFPFTWVSGWFEFFVVCDLFLSICIDVGVNWQPHWKLFAEVYSFFPPHLLLCICDLSVKLQLGKDANSRMQKQ